MLHTPTPNLQKTDSPSISLIRRALARKYSTKGPSQSTTIKQVAYYSVANPVEYPQEKAQLLPLNKCPPQITSTTRQTEWRWVRSKEINPLQHAQPNRIQLTCPPCNRPALIDRPCVGLPTQKEEQKIHPAADETTSGHKSNARNCPAAATMSPHIPPYAVVVNHPQS